MKKYEAPGMIKVEINAKEAFNATYSNCVLGEGYDLEYSTSCQDEYYVWVDSNNHQCYATPAM